MQNHHHNHIIIVGSGIAGLTTALSLAQNPSLHITLLDAKPLFPTWHPEEYDSRVYAITPASQRALAALDVWQTIATLRASPFTHMHVWDSSGTGEIHFDHTQADLPALGHIVEEQLIRAVLYEKIQAYSNIDLLCPITLDTLSEHQDSIQISPLPERSLRGERGRGEGLPPSTLPPAALLIGADGANSWVRQQSNIQIKTNDYQQTAIIAHVHIEQPHQQTARQRFLSASGVLAFLPLSDPHLCSIVWSLATPAAEELLKCDDIEFQQKCAHAFDYRLGEITATSKRHAFPLYERHVERYVKNRIALVGDAAHTIHPLAGLGVNMGIEDAVCLAEVILAAVKQGRDFASISTLRRYERARCAENTIMMKTVNTLKALFASENKSVQLLRTHGINALDRLPWLKAGLLFT